jgi:hypothetical protein
MWLDKLESELKNINIRIYKVHNKVSDGIEKLEELYKERDNITNNILEGEDYE